MASTVVANWAQVQAALALVAIRVDAADEVVEEASAQIVRALAAAGAPRLTGHMAASVDEEGGQVVVNTPYAGFQEWGTRHHKAQPFLRPAKDRSEPMVKQAAERVHGSYPMTKSKGIRRTTRRGSGRVVPVGTHELAWAAGFWDGEGCTTVGEVGPLGGKNPLIRAAVNQVNRQALDRFEAAVGFGHITGPRTRGTNKPIHQWATGARDSVHELAWLLWPWLGDVKRQQFHQKFEQFRVLQDAWMATR